MPADFYLAVPRASGLQGFYLAWAGEVNWKKGFLLGLDRYRPATIQCLMEMLDKRSPAINDELIAAVAAAYDLPNTTAYRLGKKEAVLAFLRRHPGERLTALSVEREVTCPSESIS